MESKTVFIAWTNTDLTEGRGREFPLYICETYSTAKRLGAKHYVQGTDCRVTCEKAYKIDGAWQARVYVVPPSSEDIKNEARLNAAAKAKEKAYAAGLSDEDIRAIQKGE